MKKWLFNIITLCFVLHVFHASARTPFSKDIWLNESNAPVKVNCLLIGPQGRLWLGTDEGLYNYNGRFFTAVTTVTRSVTAMALNGGNLLLGFNDGGTGVWDGEQFSVKKLTGNIPREAISAIHVVAGNTVLLSTVGEGLYCVQNNYCTQYNSGSGLSDDYVYTILPVAKNSILAATDQGLNELTFRDGKIAASQYTTANGLPDNIVRVMRPANVGHWCWIGTHQGGVALYNSITKELHALPAGKTWQWGQINDIWPVGKNRAWICTEDGYLLECSITNDDSLEVKPNYYPGQKLYKLQMDATGNLWCATNTGLKEIISEYISSIHLPTPYALAEVTAMTCDSKSECWLSQKNNVYSFRLTDEQPELKLRYTSNKPITQLYHDKNGILWVGTFGDGLWFSADHMHFNKVTGIEALEHESILDITGLGNKIWVAGLNGVEELAITQNNKLLLIRQHNKGSGIGSDYVYRIFAGKNSQIWMATDGAGVSMYRAGKYTQWDSAAGMTSNVVYSITEDNEGAIWAGTYNKGLLVYDTGRWAPLDRDNGLSSHTITTLAPMRNGGMLVVNAKGIDEWQPGSRSFRHYERRLGVGIDTVSSVLNLSATDSAGNVYIPYQHGMIFFGKPEYNVTLTPSVHIKALKTFYRETHTGRGSFPYSENHITFQYEGANFANPELLFYRYKLEGYNKEWVVTRDESVTFPQLPSGTYNFVVQSSTNSLFTTYGEASRSFSIDKPLWLQWWVLLLLAVAVWFAAYTYIRIREKNLRKLSELQKERMLFEYEHLKSQVNPHFLFNSLNTLTGLIDENKEGAMKYTSQLSDLYRNMLSHREKDLITLAEEWEILDNYIYIQKSRFGSALRLIVNVPERLKKTKRIVPMALQLLLENAIKHNIVSQAKPLTIQFDADEEKLVIRNNLQPKLSKEKGAGLGLANIRKRYAHYTRSSVVSKTENNEFIVIIPLL